MNEHKTHVSEIIETTWRDKISFDDIYALTDLLKSKTIKLTRTNLKTSSFHLWLKFVLGRKTKHKKFGATE